MNDRLRLIETLQQANARDRADLCSRETRRLSGEVARDWQLPPKQPEPKPTQQEEREKTMREIDHRIGAHLDGVRAEMRDSVDAAVEVVGEECGIIERRLRDQIDQLRRDLADLRVAIAELRVEVLTAKADRHAGSEDHLRGVIRSLN